MKNQIFLHVAEAMPNGGNKYIMISTNVAYTYPLQTALLIKAIYFQHDAPTKPHSESG